MAGSARAMRLGLVGLLLATLLPGARAWAGPPLRPVTGASASSTVFSVRLHWTRSADRRATYVSVRRVLGRTWPYPADPKYGDKIADVPARRQTVFDSGDVNPGTTFTYAIFARSGRGSSAGFSAPVYVHATTTRYQNARRFEAVYAVPKDARTRSRVQAIRRDLGAVLGWYRRQTGGQEPGFVRAHGAIVVRTLRLPLTRRQLQRRRHNDALTDVERALAASQLIGKRVLPVVYVEAASNGPECGVDGGAVAVLWMHACGGIYPSVHDTWPYGATYLAAHEMTHALGAVPDCAKHSTKDGHVNDSPRDLLYEGPKPRAWKHLVLDYRHNDYFRSGSKTCADIARDKVWTTR